MEASLRRRATRAAERAPRAGHVLGGRYRIKRVIANGGMGAVWAADDLRLPREVAVKLMHPRLRRSADLCARFEQEATVAASLQSEHIVRVEDFGRDGDAAYLVMEYLQGEDLEARVRREDRLSVGQLLPIVAQAAQGVHQVHQAGFVHCDIKPGNIFLVERSEGALVKILDFGIAEPIGRESHGEDRSALLVGSPSYMSPEQVRGVAGLDGRSDVWSLAVVVFRCVTGTLPFSGYDLFGLLAGICADPVPRASLRLSRLPPSIDEFFDRALARDLKERFASVLELSEALAALESVAADPPRPRSRSGSLFPHQVDQTMSTLALFETSPCTRPRGKSLKF